MLHFYYAYQIIHTSIGSIKPGQIVNKILYFGFKRKNQLNTLMRESISDHFERMFRNSSSSELPSTSRSMESSSINTITGTLETVFNDTEDIAYRGSESSRYNKSAHLELINLCCHLVLFILSILINVTRRKKTKKWNNTIEIVTFGTFHSIRCCILLLLTLMWSLMEAEALIRWIFSSFPVSSVVFAYPLAPLGCTLATLLLSQNITSLLNPWAFALSTLQWILQLCYAILRAYDITVVLLVSATSVAPSLYIVIASITSVLILLDIHIFSSIPKKCWRPQEIQKKHSMPRVLVKSCLRSDQASPDIISRHEKTTSGNSVSFFPSGNSNELHERNDVNKNINLIESFYVEDAESTTAEISYRHNESSFLSKITFAWYFNVLRVGWRRPLEYSNLKKIPFEESSQLQHDKFMDIYNSIKIESKGNPSMWKVYGRCYGRSLAVGGILKFFGDAANVVGPLAIAPIVHFVRKVQEGTWTLHGEIANQEYYVGWYEFLSNGCVVAWLALIASLLQASFSQASSHLLAMEGIHARTSLQTMIYAKSLKMSTAGSSFSSHDGNFKGDPDSSTLNTAEVINLTSEDTANIMSFFLHCHYIWAIPLKVIVLVLILWLQLGISAVYASVATVVVLVPLQFILAKLIATVNKYFVSASDERLRITTELLSLIRSVKANVWENFFTSRVTEAREKELNLLLKDSLLRACMTFLTQASGIIIVLLAFGFYALIEGKAPDEGAVFSSLALFSQLTVPLFILPLIVAYSIKAHRSTKRLEAFLLKTEVATNIESCDEQKTKIESNTHLIGDDEEKSKLLVDNYKAQTTNQEIEVDRETKVSGMRSGDEYILQTQKASFGISSLDSSLVLLQNINLSIPKGKLTIVIGNVGSGKTSLFLAMLKELPLMVGKMQCYNSSSAVAYVSQRPWMLNRTLKENITLFKSFNRSKYEKALNSCALKPDIKILPKRDDTEIGEGGINLSGGQRQRVAIARALYSDIPVVFLDCPFSALDSVVSEHIFQEGILKFLLLKKHATIVLATQHHHFCQYANQVIYLEENTVKFQGTPSELSSAYPELWKRWVKQKSPSIHSKDTTTIERNFLKRQVSKISMQYSTMKTMSSSKTCILDDEPNCNFMRSTKRKQSLVRSSPLNGIVTADEVASLHTVATFSRRNRTRTAHSSKKSWQRNNSSEPVSGLDSCHSNENVLLREPSIFNRRTARSLPTRAGRSSFSPREIENSKSQEIRRNPSLLSKIASAKSSFTKRRTIRKSDVQRPLQNILGKQELSQDERAEIEAEIDDEDDEESDIYEAIIDEEERMRGRISKWNYIAYLKASGWFIGFVYILFSLLNQGLAIFLDLWLGLWSSGNNTKHEEQSMEIDSYLLCNSSLNHNETKFYHLIISSHHCLELEVLHYIVVFALISGVAVIVGLVTICLAQIGAHRGRRRLHQSMLNSVVRSKVKFFDITPVGRIINRFSSDISMIDKELGWALMHLVYFSLLCSSAVIVNAVISPIFIIVTIPICLVYYTVQHLYRCTSRELKRLESLSRSPMFGLIAETVSNPVVLRAYKMQDRFESYYHRTLDSYLCSSTLLHSGNRWIGISLDYMGGIIVFLSTIACLFGALSGSSHSFLPATVGLAIRYTLSIPVYLNWLVRFLSDTEMCLNSVERIRQYTNLPQESGDITRKSSSLSTLKSLHESIHGIVVQQNDTCVLNGNFKLGQVEFRNVSLTYDKTQRCVVSQVTFLIKAGQKVAICGRTGSGKSSLLLGILRMIEIQSGCIYVDGCNIANRSLKKLRGEVSVVLQEPFSFTGSIRFNLDPGNQHKDSDLWNVLDLVLMKDFVASTLKKLDTVIGHGYLSLSSGQLQLISLARVLLEKKKLLLLDELSASFDPITERYVARMLRTELSQTTIITVAHSVASLLESDRVLVMQEGKVVEDGTPSDLIKNKQTQFCSLLQLITNSNS